MRIFYSILNFQSPTVTRYNPTSPGEKYLLIKNTELLYRCISILIYLSSDLNHIS